MDPKVAIEVKKHFRPGETEISTTGGSKKWHCLACKKVITGSATKLKAHLLGTPGNGVAACPDISVDAKNAIRIAEVEQPGSKRKAPGSYGLSGSSSSHQPNIWLQVREQGPGTSQRSGTPVRDPGPGPGRSGSELLCSEPCSTRMFYLSPVHESGEQQYASACEHISL
jgi:hypothetical protein